jgi:CheY-like chemotaxis protein
MRPPDLASSEAVDRIASGRSCPTKRNARILIAEDNPVNQEVLLAILRQLGYTADVVSNGAKAVDALRKTRYDFVLMDGEMPEMDGFEATRLIRDAAAGTLDPAIPIVAVTAAAMAGDRERCIRAGMNDYLAKPVEPGQLKRILEKWLSHPEPVPPPAAENPVFDEAGFLRRLMGNRSIAQKIVKGFLLDAESQLTSLRGTCVTGTLRPCADGPTP